MKSVTRLKTALIVLVAVGLVAGGSAVAKEKESGWLGVKMQDLSPAMAKALQLDDESGGILVSEVVDDSPAAAAGLEDGDVILEFAGKEIDDTSDLSRAVRRSEPGETVDVVVIRNGTRRTIPVELGEREEDEIHIVRRGKDGEIMEWHGRPPLPDTWTKDDFKAFKLHGMFDHGWLGIHHQELNEQLGEYFGVADGKGVLIAEVEEDSPAAGAGLQAGDVIVAIDGEEIGSQSELRHEMGDTEPDQEISLEIVRQGNRRDVSVTLGEMPEDLYTDTWIAAGPHAEMFHERWDVPHSAPHIMLKRELEFEEDELEEMKQELKKMRKELEELREEVKK
jgi:serine protease Do